MSKLLSMIKTGGKPVIGMIQLDPLPGGSRYTSGGVDRILDRAFEEADALAANGVDVLMVQNLGDLPVAQTAAASQVAWMTRVVAEVRGRFGRPVGINLLENDAEAMLAVASAAGADFVRLIAGMGVGHVASGLGGSLGGYGRGFGLGPIGSGLGVGSGVTATAASSVTSSSHSRGTAGGMATSASSSTSYSSSRGGM